MLTVILLGNGLVDMPRRLWYAGSLSENLNLCEFKASIVGERKDDADKELDATLKDFRRKADLVPESDAYLRECVERVRTKVPRDLSHLVSSQTTIDDPLSDNSAPPPTEKELADLHNRVKKAVNNYQKAHAQWADLLDKAFELEDIIRNNNDPRRRFRSSLRRPRRGRTASFLDSSEWWLRVKILPVVYRFLSIVLGIFSLAFLAAEATIPFTGVSVFSVLIRTAMNTFLLQLLVFCTLGYMVLCIQAGLFKFKFFSVYELVPRNSDGWSLLVNAYFSLKVLAATTFHCFTLFHLTRETSAYTALMAAMDRSLGALNSWLPYLICTVALMSAVLTALGVFGRISRLVLLSSFQTEDDYSVYQVGVGRERIRQERKRKEREIRGDGTGFTLQDLSSPKSFRIPSINRPAFVTLMPNEDNHSTSRPQSTPLYGPNLLPLPLSRDGAHSAPPSRSLTPSPFPDNPENGSSGASAAALPHSRHRRADSFSGGGPSLLHTPRESPSHDDSEEGRKSPFPRPIPIRPALPSLFDSIRSIFVSSSKRRGTDDERDFPLPPTTTTMTTTLAGSSPPPLSISEPVKIIATPPEPVRDLPAWVRPLARRRSETMTVPAIPAGGALVVQPLVVNGITVAAPTARKNSPRNNAKNNNSPRNTKENANAPPSPTAASSAFSDPLHAVSGPVPNATPRMVTSNRKNSIEGSIPLSSPRTSRTIGGLLMWTIRAGSFKRESKDNNSTHTPTSSEAPGTPMIPMGVERSHNTVDNV
eukprot:CAMPEP_0184664052 /NCGR_PEP_ID=MMETSP0308-20130426/50966_1 /TAXON_ID=38269 /ORGANISM="Gloeochaete witrockiana, Strain SAG 46.84" /LENGTH=760 /DNA_ID=CAMNT_0027107199 /DNA_START=617 /DNA_END=2899 /DNA_ORIENTATION=-